jgi:transglutaminase-like putative cysteine protease
LCKDIKSDFKKIIAIKNYMDENLSYDFELAENIKNGKTVAYIPNPNSFLETKKGICYDYASLFAAMCRSQGLPCMIVKGYSNKGILHAWNKVYIENRWYFVDPQK